MDSETKNKYFQHTSLRPDILGFKILADQKFDGDLEDTLKASLDRAALTQDPDHVKSAEESYQYWVDQAKLKE